VSSTAAGGRASNKVFIRRHPKLQIKQNKCAMQLASQTSALIIADFSANSVVHAVDSFDEFDRKDMLPAQCVFAVVKHQDRLW
jgi:hypothetical protein